MQFSGVQKQIIERNGGNMLVSAAAGSGKTTVMVERIIRIVTDPLKPVDLDRLLVVTFTNAAAAHMKEVIGRRLNELLEQDPDSERLQNQLLLLPNASVMTIHSFCLKILRDYIGLIPDLDPGVRVGDENERKLLLKDSLAEALESLYAEDEANRGAEKSPFRLFVEQYGGLRQDQGLEELTLELFGYIESLPNSFGWLRKQIEAYRPGAEKPLQDDALKKLLLSDIETLTDRIDSFLALLPFTTAKTKKAHDRSAYLALREQLEELKSASESQSGAELATSLGALAIPKFPPLSIEKDSVGKRAAELKESISGAFKHHAVLEAFRNQPDEATQQKSFAMLEGLYRLLERLSEYFSRAKKERNLIDFSDFEHYALQILCKKDENGMYPERSVPTAAALAVRNEYDLIFIDEYQDSNLLQEMLLTAVARRDAKDEPCNIFMVGDMKQSIYRFRHAEPELFLQKLKTYPPAEEASENEACSFSLQYNFRSAPQILECTNFLCESLMQGETGEISYGEKERLRSEKENDGFPRVKLLVAKPEKDTKFSSASLFHDEAYAIAEDIYNKLASGEKVYDKALGCERPLRLSDIVILMSSVKNDYCEELKDILSCFMLPSFSLSNINYYRTPEIRLMRELLQIIDNPRQDIPLAAVMHSIIFSFSADELAGIRLFKPDESFYEAVTACALGNSELSLKTKAFLELLESWRKASYSLSVHDLLWQILNQTGYYYQVSEMPEGRFRRANLDMLLENTLAFDRSSYTGLYQFLRYLELLDKNEESAEEAKLLGEHEELIRILTIHNSKGLEFPVVYLAGLGLGFNRRDLTKPIAEDRELGLGICYFNRGRKNPQESLNRLLIKAKIRRKMNAERMRVLYVALTRAEQQLIMSGFIKDPDFDFSDLSAYDAAPRTEEPLSLQPFRIEDGTSFLDWILSVIQLKRRAGLACPFALSVFVNSDDEEESTPIRTFLPDYMLKPKPKAYPYGEAFSWQYLYQAEGRTFARFSVTEIKKKLHAEDEEGEEPASYHPIPQKEGRGAQIGTIMHAFLANARMDFVCDEATLEEEIARQISLELLSEEDAGLLSRSELLTFFASELCGRIRKSPSVFREQPFIIRFTANEMNEIAPGWMDATGFQEDSSVMVQGIIDLFFFEEERIILVDYKTDRVLGPDQRLQYGIQLKLYKIALERILGRPVSERMLYATRFGEVISYQ